MSDVDEELLRRLDAFETRLLRIEMRLGLVRNVPPPPPIIAQPHPAPQPSQQPKAQPVRGGAWDLRGRTPPPPADAADAEYQLGGRLLPWVGAIITLLAIGYGVNLAFQHGFVTPWMIFWGGVILCTAFIVLGQIKRDEREEFGQLLTGIGSCGLYITFAAGHLAQNLYEGEPLVALFTGLSLANLAYSGWRASHAFLIIGVLGGFAGALMPLQEHKIVLHLSLHALILVPAAVIVIRQNWFREASALFVLAFAVLLPAQLESGFEWARVVSLEGAALLAAFAYARTHRPNAWDPQNVLAPMLLIGTAAQALLAQGGHEGVAHVAAFGVLLALMARLLGDRPIAPTILLTGAAIPLVVAPWGFDADARSYVFAGVAAALAALARFRWHRAASGLSGITFVLGLAAMLIRQSEAPLPWTAEIAMLGALLVAGALATSAMLRAWEETEALVLLGALLVGPLLVRIVELGLSKQIPAIGEFEGALWGLSLATAMLGALSVLTRWRSPALLAAAVGGLTLLLYGGSVGQPLDSLGWELALVTFLAVAAVAGSLAAWGIYASGRPTVAGLAGLALGLLLWRFVYLVLTESALAFDAPFAGVLGATLAAAACTAVGRWKSWPSLGVATGILWLLAGMVAMEGSPFLSRLDEGIAMAALVLAGTWGAVTFDPSEPGFKSAGRFGAGLAIGVPFSRGVVLLLIAPGVGMPSLPAITAAWTTYAAVLLVIGFMKRTRELRYVGLTALAAASVKLVLVDLASSRDLVRFLVTLGLGIAMIGGGYLYIRLQDRLGENQ